MSEKIIACGLTLEEIKGLADRVEKGGLSKIKIKADDCEVCIEKETKQVVSPAVPVMPSAVPQTADTPAQAAAEPERVSGNVIKSPLIGTYYSAPGPDKAPFVTVGQEVHKGDVVMIIESMKLMNEVTSEFDGTVKKILVKNGEAVEYGAPIMIIE